MHSYFQQIIMAFLVGVVNADDAQDALAQAQEQVGVVKRTIAAIDEALFLADGVARWEWIDHGTNLNLVVWAHDHGVVSGLLYLHLDRADYNADGTIDFCGGETGTIMGYVSVRDVPMVEWDGQMVEAWDTDTIARRIDEAHARW